MCGFAAWYDPAGAPPDRAWLQGAADRIRHRGPDDEGFFAEPGVGLAFRRLAIVDVETGHQPLSNEDGSIWIAFNGEIYNHAELRVQLEAKGHRYRTHSDTETLVHAYEEWGPDFVKRLNGMFGFAIWDRPRRRLFVARDRVGIKPVYWTKSANGTGVSSSHATGTRFWSPTRSCERPSRATRTCRPSAGAFVRTSTGGPRSPSRARGRGCASTCRTPRASRRAR